MLHLLFRLSGQIFALPADSVREIVPRPTLWRPPGMASVLAGVLNLRGTAVPVVRLARLLGLAEAAPGAFAPLIVLRRPRVWAITADAALDVLRATPRRADSVTFNGQVTGALSADGLGTDGLCAHVLSPERLLTAGEAAALESFREMAERRRAEWTSHAPA